MSIGQALTITVDKAALTVSADKGGITLPDNEVAVVSGETDVIDFTLERDGLPIDLTSASSVVLRRKSYPWSEVDSTSLVVQGDPTDGVVRLTPSAGFWASGVEYYLMEIAVTIGSTVYTLPDPDNGHFRAVVRQALV